MLNHIGITFFDFNKISVEIKFAFKVFFFSALAPNDRGYGLGRAAGEFPVAMATKEMRAQRLPKAH